MHRKVFISTTTFGEEDPSVLKVLREAGLTHVLNPHRRRLNEKEIQDILVQGNYVGLLAGLEPLTKSVLTQAKSLKVISRVGVGLDNVDQTAAKALKIKVYNTPGVLTDAVAELTIGLILASLRKIPLLDRNMRDGKWEKRTGFLLKGKVLGIIGFGHIGQQVGALAKAFGATIIFSDTRTIKKTGMKQVPFAQLLKTSDIISLHASGSDHLIGPKEIDALKPGVILVNTARGGLIHEASLLRSLASGKIAGAALDVFGEEPYQGELLKQENVILTPHIGSYAQEARILMERAAVANLIKGLTNV